MEEKKDEAQQGREFHPIGLNTQEEMAKPPAERSILVGTLITMSALELTLALDAFADKFIAAIGNTADEDGQCHPDLIDTMEMARDFACDKIREKWDAEWEERQKKAAEGGAP